jgi:hypothetical protein
VFAIGLLDDYQVVFNNAVFKDTSAHVKYFVLLIGVLDGRYVDFQRADGGCNIWCV